MSTSTRDYLQLELHFAAWALTQPAIQAVIVVGSRARADHPADEWSDLDLVVFTSDASTYLQRADWLNTFGPVWASVTNPFGAHDVEWLALYEGGLKIDVAFLTIELAATPTLQDMLDAFPYPIVLCRGVRVLVDTTPHAGDAALRLPDGDTRRLPTPDEFTTLISRMLLDMAKTAKFIRRQDLWRAKQMCDGELKQHLLRLIECHAAAQRDGRDIWYDGRFLNEWVDEHVAAALPATFAAYNVVDLRRALFATTDLFSRLAWETARRLDFIYPVEAERHVADYIRSLFAGM